MLPPSLTRTQRGASEACSMRTQRAPGTERLRAVLRYFGLVSGGRSRADPRVASEIRTIRE